MAGKVESTIIVNIKAVVDGQGNVDKFSGSIAGLKGSGAAAGQGMQSLTSQATNLASGFGKAFLGITTFIAGLALVREAITLVERAVQTLVDAIKTGLKFDSEVENAKVRIGSLIASISEITKDGKLLTGVDAFRAAEDIALQYFNRIQAASILTGAPVANIEESFQKAASAAAHAKISLDQTLNLVTLTTRAAAAMGISFDKVGQELQGLLSGNLTKRSPLAINLFGGASSDISKQIEKLIQSGQLYDVLTKKLEVFALTGKDTFNTFSGLANAAQVLGDNIAGKVVKPLFDNIEKFAKGIAGAIINLDELNKGNLVLTDGAQKIVDLVTEIVGRLTNDAASATGKLIDDVRRVGEYLVNNREYVLKLVDEFRELLRQTALIIISLLSVITDIEGARSKTIDWDDALRIIVVGFGAIRDLLNIIIGAAEVFGSFLLTLVVTPLEAILSVAASISGTFADAYKQVAKLQNGLEALAATGVDRVLSGLRLEGSLDALANVDRARSHSPTQAAAGDLTGLSTTPKPDTGEQDRTASIKRLISLVSQLAKAQRDALASFGLFTKATNDALYEDQKQSTDAAIAEVEREFKEKKLTLEDYYTTKQALEDAAFAQEREHLKENFKVTKDNAEQTINEIKEKFEGFQVTDKTGAQNQIGGLLNEPQGQKETDADFANRQHILKLQEEAEIKTQQNKLDAAQVDLNSKLLDIDYKRTKSQTDNNNAKRDALQLLNQELADINAEILAAQGQNAASGSIKIGEDLKARFKDALATSGLSEDALRTVITNINQFATLTTDQITTILTNAGVKTDDLGAKARALLTLFGQLQSNNAFSSQQESAQKILTDLNLQKDAVQNNLNRGLITETTARERILQLEQAAKDELLKIIQAMPEWTTLTKEQQQALQGLVNTTDTLAVESHKTRDAIAGIVVNGIGSFVSAVVQGTQSIGDSFRQLVSSILTGIAEMILKMLILKAIMAVLNFISPGSDGGEGLGTQLFGHGNGFAGGGDVKGPGTGTSDSILAWLSNGEWVIPAARVAQYGRRFMESVTDGTFGRLAGFAAGGPIGRAPEGSGFGGVNLRNINLIDPDMLSQHLASSAGERVMLNIISRNPAKIRQALGI